MAGLRHGALRAAALSAVILAGMLAHGAPAGAAPSYFSALGSTMAAPRAGALIATLPSGRVLIAGGTSRAGASPLSSGEEFDPANGRFAPAASLSVPRAGAVATALADGEVLVAGGTSDGSTALAGAELLNPATGHSTPLATTMASARVGAVIAPLSNGSILIAGGSAGGSALDSAELYNPASGAFTPLAARLTRPRADASAAVLPGGRVLIAGGSDGVGPLQSAELFNPATGTFTATSHLLNAARSGAVATPLPDGRVLIAGGAGAGGTAQASSELFEPSSGAFSAESPALTSARAGAVAARLGEGEVLVAGGQGAPADLNTAETFVSAPEISASGGAFGSTYVGQTSPTLALELTDVGAQQLQIYAAALGGADPEDFAIVSDECRDAIWLAFAQTCTVGVRFTPAAAGAATATLAIADNEAKPAFLQLSGAGAAAPENGAQGESGPDGAEGRDGEEGASGPEGASGRNGSVDLVTCETVTVKARKKGKVQAVRERRCTTSQHRSTLLLLCKRPSRTRAGQCSRHALALELPASATNVTAVLERRGRMRASGSGERVSGALRLRLVERQRLAAGRYQLIVAYDLAGRPRQRATAMLALSGS